MPVRRLGVAALVLALATGCTAPPPDPTSPNLPAQAPRPAAETTRPAVAVGSPVDGRWGRAGEPGSTPVGGHHRLGKAQPMNQWAADLRVDAGTPVVFRVTADSGRVTAEITQIVDGDACRAGGGGDFVTVGLYYEKTLLGRVTYAHLRRDRKLRIGAVVAPGAVLGTVADLGGADTGGPNCWTGPHVHLELRSETHAACWRDRTPGARLREGDTVGYVSGSLGSTAARCRQ
ncbi:M23 family metallopeptidase [Catellatospora tritici]|uniref:M23 family metallopeptidase n=1 Tax=Catellatospora tritici TaxID=2851566 RepID=UPI001C2D5482|nr:M23 family metallopeptidase [Catellatospora tritici]MBV1849408.1 hypothetical protein [Catellatospora tritici]